MATKLDIIKTLFDEFIQENKKSTITGLNNKQKVNFNTPVFDFQAHVFQALNSQELNLNLNANYTSDSIKKSFEEDCSAYTANDYCLSFFDFLCVNKKSTKELYELIDDFLEIHKEELTWKDIFIMSSGATRCAANLRFALNELRKWNFIKANDRSFKPSEFGEMIFYYYRKEKDLPIFEIDNTEEEQPKHDPQTNEKLKIKNQHFSVLFNLIGKIQKKENGKPSLLKAYQNHMKWQNDANEVVEILKNIDYFLKNAKITNDGIFRG